ncbi:MAG: hypothetical protein CVV27_09725 [Candidatus Melainabacteria bacterium HGW-Melainabacteria-1]|nr:MAG: hypothetical protein CVV27_09725 [Candidatus Melainabacteria bacterium HGW-Melainabacteria-1]
MAMTCSNCIETYLVGEWAKSFFRLETYRPDGGRFDSFYYRTEAEALKRIIQSGEDARITRIDFIKRPGHAATHRCDYTPEEARRQLQQSGVTI